MPIIVQDDGVDDPAKFLSDTGASEEPFDDELHGASAETAETTAARSSDAQWLHGCIAGLPAPLLYAGSYSDWVAADLPVATGPEPGTLEQR